MQSHTALTIKALQNRIGYNFRDPAILNRALTHRSAGRDNNERLEFLGDAALGFAIADALYARFTEASEADLTLMRVELVRGSTLALVAREIELGSCLSLGFGERNSGGGDRDSILADALEAVIGAVVRDGGYAAAGELVVRLLKGRLDSVQEHPIKDPKTLLQEELQSQGDVPPHYHVVEKAGEAHKRRYRVECRVDVHNLVAFGEGTSRRDAEKEAAEAILKELGKRE